MRIDEDKNLAQRATGDTDTTIISATARVYVESHEELQDHVSNMGYAMAGLVMDLPLVHRIPQSISQEDDDVDDNEDDVGVV